MRQRALLAGGLVLVLLATWAAYAPSQGHLPRADHWWFLHNTSDLHDFGPLLARTYSYNRAVVRGDYQLFRPVLFALLSAEKALFGHDFARWQRVGVALHLVVVALLVAVAWRAGLRWLGLGLGLFFGLNFAVVEMVIWSHINGYLLFLVFVLGAILLTLDVLLRDAETNRWRLGLAWVLLLAAAFTHEIGQYFAVVVGAVLALDAAYRRHQRRAWVRFVVFAAVLLLYQAADQLDRRANPLTRRDVTYGDLLEAALSCETVTNTARYVLFTLVQPFAPGAAEYGPETWTTMSRLGVSEPYHHWAVPESGSWLLLLSLTAGSLVVLRTAAAVRALALDRARRPLLLFLLVSAGLFALHLGITVLGRLNLRPGGGTLSNNSYYTYLPLVMLLIGLAAAWSVPLQGRWPARLNLGLVVSLGLLAAVCGVRTHDLNRKVKDQLRPSRIALEEVARFARSHGDQHRVTWDEECDRYLGRPFGVPALQILYPRLVTGTGQPTHRLTWCGGKPKVEAITPDEEASSTPPTPHPAGPPGGR